MVGVRVPLGSPIHPNEIIVITFVTGRASLAALPVPHPPEGFRWTLMGTQFHDRLPTRRTGFEGSQSSMRAVRLSSAGDWPLVIGVGLESSRWFRETGQPDKH